MFILDQIKQYDSEITGNETLKGTLREMTAQYEEIVQKVIDTDYPDYLRFSYQKTGGNGRKYHHGISIVAKHST